MTEGLVIEVGHHQAQKHAQAACGDVFLSRKVERGDRTLSVLADGLGSGIKASVLAHLTATMAIRYMASDADARKAAGIILSTLPVCRERQVAYATFSIVEMEPQGATRILEFETPAFVLLRGGQAVPVAPEILPLPGAGGREASLRHVRFEARPGDRVVFFTDGVSQAGMGRPGTPLGWGQAGAAGFLVRTVREQPGISALQLARALVRRAQALDGGRAKDDISCGVMYYRQPREILVLTGAPVDRARDPELAASARAFRGRKIICGGTTAAILGRELGLPLAMDPALPDPEVPPASRMEGFDLVTEGALTLSRASRILEEDGSPEPLRPHAATRLAALLRESDIIHIVAGTRINEALQDPNLPQDLDIRRNILRELRRVLVEKHLKDVRIRFL